MRFVIKGFTVAGEKMRFLIIPLGTSRENNKPN